MGTTLHLVSDIPPSVNHYLAYRAVLKNGKPIGTSYKTPEAVRYQERFRHYVWNEVRKQGWKLKPNKEQHFYVDGYFYFPRVDMDCNNYWKCLLDAITDTKKIWLDDNVVCERAQRIYYDPEHPRVELNIYPVDYIGIFDDLPQLEQFEAHCIGCNRYKRNCSLLENAKAGKIQKEIEQCQCKAYKQIATKGKSKKQGELKQ